MKVRYLKSAVLPQDYPPGDRIEVAITGRSNAGKSSLINAIVGSSVAKVSGSPGKTRLLNFFDVGDFYRIVDMPGYGYASRSGSEMREWHKMIETYFSVRSQVGCIVLVMDVRRKWSEDEDILVKFAKQIGKPILLVLTKMDKLNNKEKADMLKAHRETCNVSDIFSVSSTNKSGVEEFEEALFEKYIKPLLSSEAQI